MSIVLSCILALAALGKLLLARGSAVFCGILLALSGLTVLVAVILPRIKALKEKTVLRYLDVLLCAVLIVAGLFTSFLMGKDPITTGRDENNKVAALLARDENEKAAELLMEYEQDEKSSDLIHINRAVLHLRQGNAEKAVASLKLVSPQFRNASADYEFLMGLYGMQKDDDTAAGHFKAALKKDPNLLEALVYLGTYYNTASDGIPAFAYLRQADLVAPENPEVNYQLGRAYFRIMEYDTAKLYFEAAQKFGASDERLTDIQAHLAIIAEEGGDSK